MKEYAFGDEHPFLEKVHELVKSGVDPERIETFTPVPVHGLEEALQRRPSLLKFFFLFGGLLGCFTGYAFPIYTALRWGFETKEFTWDQIVVGGKPAVAIPAYTIIGFELTVLFGALITLFGFLLLSRMPKFLKLVPDKEYGNQFVIVVADEEHK